MGIKTVTIYKDHLMYSQIHAENAEKESSGKTTKVDFDDAEDLNFTINSRRKTLEISASCRVELSNGARGGEYRSINRTFYLRLERGEVEKLVTTALNNKLLKKLDINNLDRIDLVGKLELDIERYKVEMDKAQKEIKRLHKLIDRAKVALNES